MVPANPSTPSKHLPARGTLDGVSEPKPTRGKQHADERVLPLVSGDARDLGWGDPRESRRDAAWYERERPPHHG
jgi:hypothetical protein